MRNIVINKLLLILLLLFSHTVFAKSIFKQGGQRVNNHSYSWENYSDNTTNEDNSLSTICSSQNSDMKKTCNLSSKTSVSTMKSDCKDKKTAYYNCKKKYKSKIKEKQGERERYQKDIQAVADNVKKNLESLRQKYLQPLEEKKSELTIEKDRLSEDMAGLTNVKIANDTFRAAMELEKTAFSTIVKQFIQYKKGWKSRLGQLEKSAANASKGGVELIDDEISKINTILNSEINADTESLLNRAVASRERLVESEKKHLEALSLYDLESDSEVRDATEQAVKALSQIIEFLDKSSEISYERINRRKKDIRNRKDLLNAKRMNEGDKDQFILNRFDSSKENFYQMVSEKLSAVDTSADTNASGLSYQALRYKAVVEFLQLENLCGDTVNQDKWQVNGCQLLSEKIDSVKNIANRTIPDTVRSNLQELRLNTDNESKVSVIDDALNLLNSGKIEKAILIHDSILMMEE